jgi:hypothetical protein
LLHSSRITEFQQLVFLQKDWFIINHTACSDFRTLCIKQNGGVTVGSLLKSFLDTYHLTKMFRMISVGEVKTRNIQTLINEDAGVIRMLSFWSDCANCFGTFGGFRELVKEEIGRKRMEELWSSSVLREAASDDGAGEGGGFR